MTSLFQKYQTGPFSGWKKKKSAFLLKCKHYFLKSYHFYSLVILVPSCILNPNKGININKFGQKMQLNSENNWFGFIWPVILLYRSEGENYIICSFFYVSVQHLHINELFSMLLLCLETLDLVYNFINKCNLVKCLCVFLTVLVFLLLYIYFFIMTMYISICS